MVRDDTDRMRDGDLPADPFEDAEPMEPPADAVAELREERARHLQAAEAVRRRAEAMGIALDEDKEERVDLDQRRLVKLLPDAVERMTARREGRERPVPLPWTNVAEALGGGLWPGLHVLVGNTGTGKSQWAMQAALHAACEGVPVLYIGLELDEVGLVARLVALCEDRAKWSDLYLGKRDPGELLTKHGSLLDALPLHMDVAPPMGWPYSRLRAATDALRDLYPVGEGDVRRPTLVVLDYLQLVASPDGTREDLRERIGRAAYYGRAVARDLDAAVLLVSSTAREHYWKLSGRKPKNRDGAESNAHYAKPAWEEPANLLVGTGKESGEVEYAADSVLVLAAEPWGSPKPPPEGTRVHLAVAKVRAGPACWVNLLFDWGRFQEPNPPRHETVSV